jgi:hypothetical protein
MAAGSFILPLLPDIIDFEVNNAVEGQVNNTAPTGVVLLDTDLNQINPVSITQISNYFEIVIATGSIVPAIIEINGVAFKTVDPGDTLDILIENSDLVSVGTPDSINNRVDIADSTLLIQKSDSTLIFSFDIAAEDLDFYNVADSVITNAAVSPTYTANVKATEGLILPDQTIEVNTVNEGAIPSVGTIEIDITDGTNPVTPNDVTIVGRKVTVEVPSGGGTPSGVLFKTIEPSQYTSYRDGDEGWRVQNGWYDYTPPAIPKTIAELDFSIGANFFFKLKNPLIVNGISSTERFVDVNGVQVFSTTGAANLVLIDKLTGMMITRTSIAAGNWDFCIDTALTHSIVVNGVTFDDWHLISLPECLNIFGTFFRNVFSDPITSNQIFSNANNTYFTATTTINSTTTAQANTLTPANCNYNTISKTLSRAKVFIRDCRNLITAP